MTGANNPFLERARAALAQRQSPIGQNSPIVSDVGPRYSDEQRAERLAEIHGRFDEFLRPAVRELSQAMAELKIPGRFLYMTSTGEANFGLPTVLIELPAERDGEFPPKLAFSLMSDLNRLEVRMNFQSRRRVSSFMARRARELWNRQLRVPVGEFSRGKVDELIGEWLDGALPGLMRPEG